MSYFINPRSVAAAAVSGRLVKLAIVLIALVGFSATFAFMIPAKDRASGAIAPFIISFELYLILGTVIGITLVIIRELTSD